ncbi:MAG: hypothetical protein ACI8PT_000668 [Gammaproteobacteria bacterium]|jgi:hypothetical protein
MRFPDAVACLRGAECLAQLLTRTILLVRLDVAAAGRVTQRVGRLPGASTRDEGSSGKPSRPALRAH